jgi:hypothetical protein
MSDAPFPKCQSIVIYERITGNEADTRLVEEKKLPEI